ncbi:hypothetical protein ACI2JM_00905 [Psychrobacter sp. NPDC064578]|uniref:hypothetical protein n=1 Tax=Psychrobacter sp. NPDC064578 TaxID=3364493 RepID=UPI00384AC348
MNKYLALFVATLLLGCAPSVEVTPNKLPDAYLNQPYEANINIINSAVDDLTFYSTFSDASFKTTPEVMESGQDDYNNLTISGLPTTINPMTVYISGNTYGTNFPGKYFEKEYTIEMKVTE